MSVSIWDGFVSSLRIQHDFLLPQGPPHQAAQELRGGRPGNGPAPSLVMVFFLKSALAPNVSEQMLHHIRPYFLRHTQSYFLRHTQKGWQVLEEGN